MGNYLIKRKDEHGWVSEFGAQRYTRYFDWAAYFKTRGEAEAAMLPDIEVLVDVEDLVVKPQDPQPPEEGPET